MPWRLCCVFHSVSSVSSVVACHTSILPVTAAVIRSVRRADFYALWLQTNPPEAVRCEYRRLELRIGSAFKLPSVYDCRDAIRRDLARMIFHRASW